MATPSHGALLAFEMDPIGSPDVFTTIGELNGDISVNLTRAATETPTHNRDIDIYVQGMLRRDEWPVSVNYTYGDATHQTLRAHFLNGVEFKMRFRGRGGLTDTDEMIATGFLTGWNQGNAVGDGVRSAEGGFRPTGEMTIDGVTYGAAA